MARDSYGRHCRPGVLAVSPPEYPEMPDEYMDKAREQLRTDPAWIAEQIADGVDAVIADLLTDTGYANQNVRDVALCNRLRTIVAQAIEREAPDLAESLWQRDIEESQQAAAEYAADRD